MSPHRLDRRQFIQKSTATSIGFAGLGLLLECPLQADWLHKLAMPGYGPLQPDPGSVIDLPKGFSYQVISIAGDTMNDGVLVPGKHDGMGTCLGPDGTTVIIRNHEISPGHRCIGPFDPELQRLSKIDKTKIYDLGKTEDGGIAPSRGGCTRLVFDTRGGRESGQLISHELALVGTEHNCAGGMTPRNTWLSCEESVVGPEHKPTWTKPHGYVFEVPGTPGAGLVQPEPIISMGRMNHEAVAVDARTGIVYLTEDRNDGCIYRFIPVNSNQYLEGGRLEALAISGRSSADLRHWEPPMQLAPGDSLSVRWIPVEDVDSKDDSLRYQAVKNGAALFARGEGMWAGQEEIYFACTTGGANKRGQIWRYRPADPQVEGTPLERLAPRGRLMLMAEPNDAAVVEHADNLTVSPWGDLIVCEDGPDEQFLLGVTPSGQFYRLGRNAMNESEFAGAAFSPDASTLFVNIQNPGLTLAIRGPWRT